ncbi:unnamed protein product [Owenia fusiformis]|uniref:Uncharacterized protein n=1 Tax=Owenia fusiformis TaxID=6347 RepID=A0A8J1TBZ9_OWEFU|nr:unnamed protein product [Owenia fusiformis]
MHNVRFLGLLCLIGHLQTVASRYTLRWRYQSDMRCRQPMSCDIAEICCRDMITKQRFCAPANQNSLPCYKAATEMIVPVSTEICENNGKKCDEPDICCSDPITNSVYCTRLHGSMGHNMSCMFRKAFQP